MNLRLVYETQARMTSKLVIQYAEIVAMALLLLFSKHDSISCTDEQ